MKNGTFSVISARVDILIWLIAILLIALVVSAAVIFGKKHINLKRQGIVAQNSTMLKALSEVNSKFNFDSSIRYEYPYTKYLDSKPKYDSYKLSKLLDDKILQNPWLMKAADVTKKNSELYNEYKKEVASIHSEITKTAAAAFHVPYKKYLEIEERLFKEQQLHPVIKSYVLCAKEYTSPAGRNHYSDCNLSSAEYVQMRGIELQEQIEYQNSEEARRKRERSKMSPQLRYQILQRDHFRCQICGRTQEDGVKLHVDHIIPVSKGGETVPKNLRTLCDECNLGKGDKKEDMEWE